MTRAGKAAGAVPGVRRQRSLPQRIRRGWAGYAFVAGYVILLVWYGVGPTVYSLYLAFTDADGRFAGLSNITTAAQDFRFLPAIGHVAAFLAVWLAMLVVLVVGLALLLHGMAARGISRGLRFVYYLPGALAGAASVLVWLFMLDPTVSPVGFLLRWIGYGTFGQVIAPGHLPVLFAIVAFWTGAGGWIVVTYGALNTIPTDVIEAARIDGAGRWQVARRIQLPMLRKWIAYMLILAFAGGTQLFVEPQLVAQASLAVAGRDWSMNQLSYTFAFQMNNINAAAAISMELLLTSLVVAAVFVARSGLFDVD